MRIAFLLISSLTSPYGLGRCFPQARQLAYAGHDVHVIAQYHGIGPRVSRHTKRNGVWIRSGDSRAKRAAFEDRKLVCLVPRGDAAALADTIPARKSAQADLFLGAFGITPKSLMTVQNKIYEGLAMRRPVLIDGSVKLRATLIGRQHAYLVPRAEPAALADAILDLKAKSALRERLAAERYDLFRSRFTPIVWGAPLARYLHEVKRQ